MPGPAHHFHSLTDHIDAELLKERRLFFSDQVNNDTAADMIRRLWYLEQTAPGKPILFVINSPGGSVDSGFAIWDQVRMITSPVTTMVTGLAASMGSIITLSAPKGRRFATTNARFMVHQPLIAGVIQGQATDLEIQAKEMLKTHNRLIDLYVECTGKSRDYIAATLDRDTWMSAEEAKEFGHIDQVVTDYSQLKLG